MANYYNNLSSYYGIAPVVGGASTAGFSPWQQVQYNQQQQQYQQQQNQLKQQQQQFNAWYQQQLMAGGNPMQPQSPSQPPVIPQGAAPRAQLQPYNSNPVGTQQNFGQVPAVSPAPTTTTPTTTQQPSTVTRSFTSNGTSNMTPYAYMSNYSPLYNYFSQNPSGGTGQFQYGM